MTHWARFRAAGERVGFGVLDQQGRCPLTVFSRQLCWEINQAMGVANDEDRGFRRVDEMCAAKPLGAERFERADE